MKLPSLTHVLTCLLALCLLSQNVPARACEFGTETYFYYTTHPDFPLSKYAAGQLGFVDSNFARSYLLVAYRYLSGLPLSSAAIPSN